MTRRFSLVWSGVFLALVLMLAGCAQVLSAFTGDCTAQGRRDLEQAIHLGHVEQAPQQAQLGEIVSAVTTGLGWISTLFENLPCAEPVALAELARHGCDPLGKCAKADGRGLQLYANAAKLRPPAVRPPAVSEPKEILRARVALSMSRMVRRYGK